MGHYTNSVFETVKVVSISSTGAQVMTSYSSQISVKWANGLPDPAPQVGEIWMVQQYASNRWRFVNRIGDGDTYNTISYMMSLDARTCIGKERAIVDDIAKLGVDEVYLKVADKGLVLWDSDAASLYGLKSYGDHVTQLINRFVDYGISITLVIGCTLWSDTTSKTHNLYQQVGITKNVSSEGLVTYTEHFSRYLSCFSAYAPLKVLLNELYVAYRQSVRGVCLEGFRLDGEHSDFSQAAKTAYVSMYGETPTYSFTEYDATDSSWWDKHFQWMAFQSGGQLDFYNRVHQDIGNWPISIITTAKTFCDTDSNIKTGRLVTGIEDDFSSYGWEQVGFPLAYTRQSDSAAELRSFEYVVACEQRFSAGCKPLYVLDISTLTQYDGIFEILSKYGASNVLLSDYDHFRLLSDQQVIDLKSAMGTYKVQPNSTLDYIGVVLSNDSRDIGFYDLGVNTKFTNGLENMCSELLDKLPHRLRILFDADLADYGVITNTAAVVLYMASNLSDIMIDNINAMIAKDDKNIVIAGRAGQYIDKTNSERSSYPFVDTFGQADYQTQEYVREITIGGTSIDVTDNTFVLKENNTGIKLALDGGDSTSYIQTVDTASPYQSVKAPVLFQHRSSMLGIDVIYDNLLLEIVSELALYALGRDA